MSTDLAFLNRMRVLERIVSPNLPDYHNEGRTVVTGQDIPPHLMEALKGGEVLTLVDPDGRAIAILIIDGYGNLRTKLLTATDKGE